MTDELRIQALQAALDQANMQIIEQREVMQVALYCLEDIFGKNKVDVGAINALREMLGCEE
jgi:energy-converting hydrogenase A subunit M